MKNRRSLKRSDEAVQVVKINEVSRVLRWLIVVGGIVACVWIITDAVVKIMDEPAWVTVVAALIVAIAGPSGIIALLIKRQRRYTRHNQERLASLERAADPRRTSSGLRADGTNPPEDGL